MSKRIKALLSAVLVMIHEFDTWLERRRIRVYAAQASFFIVVSVIPFLIVMLSLFGNIIPVEMGSVENSVVTRLPHELRELALKVLDEAGGRAGAGIISINAAVLFWSALRGMKGIGAGIRNVYGGEYDSNILSQTALAAFFSLLWGMTVILTLVTLVFGDILMRNAASEEVRELLGVLNGGAFIILLTSVFSLTYCGYSGKRLNFFSQLGGAFFAAVGWLAYSRIFEYYIENLADRSYIHGGLTSIAAVMLWLYFCMKLLLVGAGINAALCKS